MKILICNRLFVDREFRIKELKEKIKVLKEAGIRIAESPAAIGTTLIEILR